LGTPASPSAESVTWPRGEVTRTRDGLHFDQKIGAGEAGLDGGPGRPVLAYARAGRGSGFAGFAIGFAIEHLHM
jgi:hypothetical protein